MGFCTDLLGPHFTALCFTEAGDVPSEVSATCERLAQARVPFAWKTISRRPALRAGSSAYDHSGRLFPMYDAKPGTLYLVRPDGHVMARWRDANADELVAALDAALNL
jgi:3-(3-hydroxy-phenyl)propionate hydroxylase